MLERLRERAPAYDRDNTFFHEDFAELRDAGYLKIAVPTELGGGGLNLAQVARVSSVGWRTTRPPTRSP